MAAKEILTLIWKGFLVVHFVVGGKVTPPRLKVVRTIC